MLNWQATRSTAQKREPAAERSKQVRALTTPAAEFRAGYIAIIGRPNVGKSTLLNHLLGQKISITSSKAQTTRHRIAGILTQAAAQFVFVDTPGFQQRHKSALNKIMNRTVIQSMSGVDVIVWVVEALVYGAEDADVLALLPADIPVICVINKVDRVKEKNALLPFVEQLSGLFPFSAIVPLSAQKALRLDVLLAALQQYLPEQAALFGEDEITDRSERFLAAEMVREKIFREVGEEVPYSITVEIEKFEQQGNLRKIYAAVLVDKEGQKAIIIGERGAKLKSIGTQARKDMEKLFGGKVYLELWVKVKSGWADSEARLKQLGYE